MRFISFLYLWRFIFSFRCRLTLMACQLIRWQGRPTARLRESSRCHIRARNGCDRGEETFSDGWENEDDVAFCRVKGKDDVHGEGGGGGRYGRRCLTSSGNAKGRVLFA